MVIIVNVRFIVRKYVFKQSTGVMYISVVTSKVDEVETLENYKLEKHLKDYKLLFPREKTVLTHHYFGKAAALPLCNN